MGKPRAQDDHQLTRRRRGWWRRPGGPLLTVDPPAAAVLSVSAAFGPCAAPGSLCHSLCPSSADGGSEDPAELRPPHVDPRLSHAGQGGSSTDSDCAFEGDYAAPPLPVTEGMQHIRIMEGVSRSLPSSPLLTHQTVSMRLQPMKKLTGVRRAEHRPAGAFPSGGRDAPRGRACDAALTQSPRRCGLWNTEPWSGFSDAARRPQTLQSGKYRGHFVCERLTLKLMFWAGQQAAVSQSRDRTELWPRGQF
ncbi:hypothetical protein ANANG_G00042980 [Anguilla anguilla]|uniref:Protein TANC2 n=1 Tax=Anguilla anguilla TaxID=7936 RepID=A0A9D3MU45_ANGAN|nr:hypothetical protein ANANG_G00042980 [Anguilla anguilla]